jgi:CheY-like chemotaxis protein
MTLSSLLVCFDEAAVELLSRVLKELRIQVELCPDAVRAAVRLAQDRYDLLIVDCEEKADVVAVLQECRSSRANETTLAVVVAEQGDIREMFSLGVNFVLYKPLSYERVMSSLKAAHAVLYRDKRGKTRTAVHTHATIDYAGGEQEKATLVDLSEDGMAVNFGKKLPQASKVYFQFQLPGQTTPVRLSGNVMWQDWNGRAGIQFVDVPKASRKVLHEWLERSLADAPKRELAAEVVEVMHSTQPKETEPKESRPKESSVEVDRHQAGTIYTAKREIRDRDEKAGARLRAEPDNRRGQARYACRLGAEVYQQGSSVRNYCHLSDLSPGGCYLEMPLAFAAGTAVEITVRTQEMKLRLSGKVKASHPGYGMGVSFTLSSKDERQGVQQLIDFVAAAAETSS